MIKASEVRVGIAVVEGCQTYRIVNELLRMGCREENLTIKIIPNDLHLALGVLFFAEYTEVDAVIALGCVIQGETRHFDFICQGVTQGIMQLQLQWNMPIAFGVLTVEDQQQALDRCGGALGNKGDEAAATAIQMVKLQIEMDAASPDREPDRRNIN